MSDSGVDDERTPLLPSAERSQPIPAYGKGPSKTASPPSDPGPSKPLECKCKAPPPGIRGRNLVICIDGTANQFGLKNTHVVELFSRLNKDAEQLTYYNSGIGTFVMEPWSLDGILQWVRHKWDMAVAWHLKDKTLGAYRWVSEKFRDGDRIYIFGFSRGAYQARILAGMIHKVGLLHEGNNDQIPFAYELYVADTANRTRLPEADDLSKHPPTPEQLAEVEKNGRKDPRYTSYLCWKFKQALSHKDATVHFVGAWDTVSSVGITWGPTLPETTTGMHHVCFFRHALSLDEGRGKFLPEYANGGSGPTQGVGNVKEVWFDGSHSDIGGGNTPNLGLDKFGPALRFVVYEGVAQGLRVKSFEGAWAASEHTPSLARWSPWWLLEIYPFRRNTYNERGLTGTTRWPHRGAGRIIQDGQRIHRSVLDYMKTNPGYQTMASTADGSKLTLKLLESTEWKDRIEDDVWSVSVEGFLRELKTAVDSQGDIAVEESKAAFFTEVASSVVGKQAIGDYPDAAKILLDALVRVSPSTDDVSGSPQPIPTVVVSIAAGLAAFDTAPPNTHVHAYRTLEKWLPHPVPKRHREQISRVFSVIKGHEDCVWSVALSPDRAYIASASDDSTIQLWDARTFSPAGVPLRGHEGRVNSVVFSPDSARVASGGDDRTVRIWDVQTLRAVGEPLRGHEGAVWSVAFASDGKTIASGSWDRTIRLWDAATGGAVGEPFSGHTDYVRSIAFTPNDTRLVSASDDKTIRIWDIETHEVLKVLEGHIGAVWSIAVSHDGTRIVSGSDDGTLRIWDAETGQAAGDPIRGHTYTVWSVAFSPDDRYVVSGSLDETVRLWRADTGEAVGEPLRGHGWVVSSVAFSPDGERIVSGSADNTLRIW